MSDNIYRDIMADLKDRGVMIVVDATKDLLLNVLEYHPFLIKHNNHELAKYLMLSLQQEKKLFLMEESFRKKEPEMC